MNKLIPKFLRGGTPHFFKAYGIKSNKFIEMFNALIARGLSNLVAFEITWQSLKEKPKVYYSFGTDFDNVNKWADNVVNHLLNREDYKNARHARNYDEYMDAILPAFNSHSWYRDWLKQGRDLGKKFINEYIEENNLGKPVVMNLMQDTDYYYG